MSTALAKEIVRNTPLGPGQRMTAAALGEVSTAWGEGRVSGDALNYAESLFDSGGSLPNVDVGGGGGGGGIDTGDGSDEPEVDPDLVSVSDCVVSSESEIGVGETATLFAELANGNNQAVEATVRFEADNAAGAATTSVAAGRTGQASAELLFNSPGTYQFDASIEDVRPL